MLKTETGSVIGGQAERIFRRKDMPVLTGLCIAEIYERIAEGTFPKPVPLGGRPVGWLERDIVEWQKARIAERDASITGEAA
jgi:prophage regulatory protein